MNGQNPGKAPGNPVAPESASRWQIPESLPTAEEIAGQHPAAVKPDGFQSLLRDIPGGLSKLPGKPVENPGAADEVKSRDAGSSPFDSLLRGDIPTVSITSHEWKDEDLASKFPVDVSVVIELSIQLS